MVKNHIYTHRFWQHSVARTAGEFVSESKAERGPVVNRALRSAELSRGPVRFIFRVTDFSFLMCVFLRRKGGEVVMYGCVFLGYGTIKMPRDIIVR